MSTVSVIVPVYNGQAHLAQALRSVAAQTLQPLELFIVDDGSSDQSCALAESFEVPFPKTLLHQVRQFQSAARNRAAAQARGKYLAFLDHDDAWYPQHLAQLVAPMEADARVGWTYCDMDEMDIDGALVALQTLSFYAPHVRHPKTDIFSMLADDMFIFPSAAVVRREAFAAVGGFDERLSGYEDDDLFLRLFRAGWHNRFVAEPSTLYRRHVSSSSFSPRMWQSRDIFAGKLLQAYPDNPELMRFFVRDIIAPRFFRSAVREYVRHLPHQRWEQCQMSLDLMARFRALMGQPTGWRRLAYTALTALMRHPQAFARWQPLLKRSRRVSAFLR